MFDLMNFQASGPFLALVISFMCVLFWVSYSIQDCVLTYRKTLKKKMALHRREVELFREELKKRR